MHESSSPSNNLLCCPLPVRSGATVIQPDVSGLRRAELGRGRVHIQVAADGQSRQEPGSAGETNNESSFINSINGDEKSGSRLCLCVCVCAHSQCISQAQWLNVRVEHRLRPFCSGHVAGLEAEVKALVDRRFKAHVTALARDGSHALTAETAARYAVFTGQVSAT